MAVVRILVDGYSLLHEWTDIAPGSPRFSAQAREELVQKMTLYQDAVNLPITIVFDGAGAHTTRGNAEIKTDVEILYSRTGLTADAIIERVAHRMKPYGEVLAVTDDHAERDTVVSLGGVSTSCLSFIQEVENTLVDLNRTMKQINAREQRSYKNRKS
jgi:predicted RNA-binding protein with PIN domain